MKIDYDKIMERANTLYADAALTRMGVPKEDIAYMAPEQFPKIYSEQLKCFAKAIVEAINND